MRGLRTARGGERQRERDVGDEIAERRECQNRRVLTGEASKRAKDVGCLITFPGPVPPSSLDCHLGLIVLLPTFIRLVILRRRGMSYSGWYWPSKIRGGYDGEYIWPDIRPHIVRFELSEL